MVNLSFSVDDAPARFETIIHDAGDNNLVLLTVSAGHGIACAAPMTTKGARTVAVIDHWRLRGADPDGPDFRVLTGRQEVDHAALRASCLYDHLVRMIDFAGLSGEAITIAGFDQALGELDRAGLPRRRSPAG